MLIESLDQGDTKRPDVRGRRNGLNNFRCVIHSRCREVSVILAHHMNAVPGNLYLIVDNHDVRWPEVTMYQTSLVKIGERVEDRVEHLSGFRGRQRSLWNNLRE